MTIEPSKPLTFPGIKLDEKSLQLRAHSDELQKRVDHIADQKARGFQVIGTLDGAPVDVEDALRKEIARVEAMIITL